MTHDEGYQEAEQLIAEAQRTNATELNLIGFGLTSLPQSLFQLTQLQKLNLLGNQLNELPKEIEQLKNLQKLDLENNQLNELPKEIGQLKNLQKLDLRENQLNELPKEIGQLKNLQTLDLRENQLNELPEEIAQLKNLQTLSLYNNQLNELPKEIGQLKNLQELDLENNQLNELPKEIGQLKNLQTLHLYTNQLNELPKEIGQLKNLQKLYLYNNQLNELPKEITQLKNLQTLDIESNKLATLPEQIGQLNQLQTLDLSNNRLKFLPTPLRELTSLQVLYLHDNPDLGIPPEILGPAWQVVSDKEKPANPQEILDYYFQPKKPLNEAKLILVGFGKAGKTSLVNRLVHDRFDKDEQKTEGIAITEWPVVLPVEEEAVQLHVWDFGGQEIMHSTHQFFLSHRSLYLLVLNGRQGHEDADAEYWMDLIRSFGGASPVLVVLNKQKEHPFGLNEQNLQAKFPGMIKGFIKTECADPPQGIAELKQRILEETRILEGRRDEFPIAWFEIKDKLAAMTENYLTFEEYRALCTDMGAKAKMDQDRLAGHLHRLGVALNYKDDSRLRDMHVLNPRWVTEGIYSILNARELEERKGELHLDCLKHILDPTDYPEVRHPFLLNLMRKFYLCFEFPDREGHYLIPDLADKNQPEEASAFEPKNCLNFQYQYARLHEGVLPSFIARTYIHSEKQPRWRTGVILSFEGCRALVKGDLTEGRVDISITGPNPDAQRRTLAVIRTNFESIHSNFETKPKEHVPIPGYPETSIPYKELLVFEHKGIKTKQQVIGDDVLELDVQELLNGVDLEGARRKNHEAYGKDAKGARVFYSYAHKDEALREELETHLKILHRTGHIHSWHDRRIVGGEEWKGEIDQHLEEADIILLLVSADFLASDYCYNTEMKRALERHEAGEARVIPIILRDCLWEDAPFAKLQACHKDAKPVIEHNPRDMVWKEIATNLKNIAESLRKKG